MNYKKKLHTLLIFSFVSTLLVSCESDEKIIDLNNDFFKMSKNKVFTKSNTFLLTLFNIDTSIEFTGIITSSYPNGKRKYRIKYSHGLVDGESEYFYSNGNLQKKGRLKQSMEVLNKVELLSIDTWKYYDSIGNLKMTKNYNIYGNLDGPFIEYNSDGTLKTTGSYIKGKKNGEWIDYLNNEKNEVKNYISEEKTTTKKVKLNKGGFQELIVDKESGLTLSGILINENKNSNEVTRSFTYQKIVNGRKNGEFKSYRDTLLISDGFYKDNLLISYNTYFDNGKIESVTRFIENPNFPNNTLPHGLYTEYYYDGELKLKGNYFEGMKDGLYTEYYKNGELKLKGNYFKGKKRGNWYFMSKYTENYNDEGRLNGLYKQYYDNGKLYLKGYYKEGEQTGKWTYYRTNGKIYDEGYYKNNLLNGKWTSYFNNGEVESERYYKNNLKIGKWKYYNKKNGTILRVEEYN